MSSPWKELGKAFGGPETQRVASLPDHEVELEKRPHNDPSLHKYISRFDGSYKVLFILLGITAMWGALFIGGLKEGVGGAAGTGAAWGIIFALITFFYWQAKQHRTYLNVDVDVPDLPAPDLTPPTKGNMRLTFQRRTSTKAREGRQFTQYELLVWIVLSEAAREFIKRSSDLPRTLIYERPIDPDTLDEILKYTPDFADTMVQYTLADVLKTQPFSVTTEDSYRLDRAEAEIKSNLETVGHLINMARDKPPTQSDSYEI